MNFESLPLYLRAVVLPLDAQRRRREPTSSVRLSDRVLGRLGDQKLDFCLEIGVRMDELRADSGPPRQTADRQPVALVHEQTSGGEDVSPLLLACHAPRLDER